MNPAPLNERLGELSLRIEEWLNESHRKAEALRRILEEARRETRDALPGPRQDVSSGSRSHADLARFTRDLAGRCDQTGILEALLAAAASCAQRAILFVARNESFTGWAARGFAPDFVARSINVPVSADNLLSLSRARCWAVRESPASRDGNAALAKLLGGPAPHEMVAAPLWVRDRVAAVLYADSADTKSPLPAEEIGVMASMAGLSLEAIPWRQKHPRPAAPEPPAPAPPQMHAGQDVKDDAPEPAPAARATEPQPEPEPEMDPEELSLHDAARRFARLLVSEIVLYNGAELDEGRRHKDIYQRLKEEIDRSHQMYEQRVAPKVLDTADYFRQELVRVLAQGDESAIALPWG